MQASGHAVPHTLQMYAVSSVLSPTSTCSVLTSSAPHSGQIGACGTSHISSTTGKLIASSPSRCSPSTSRAAFRPRAQASEPGPALDMCRTSATTAAAARVDVDLTLLSCSFLLLITGTRGLGRLGRGRWRQPGPRHFRAASSGWDRCLSRRSGGREYGHPAQFASQRSRSR